MLLANQIVVSNNYVVVWGQDLIKGGVRPPPLNEPLMNDALHLCSVAQEKGSQVSIENCSRARDVGVALLLQLLQICLEHLFANHQHTRSNACSKCAYAIS